MELKNALRSLKRQEGDPCVSILLNTHRTFPENAQDPINLKNLVAATEKRLLKAYDKRAVWPLLERLHAAVAGIDHTTNLDGLALFAKADMAEVVKLNVPVTDRVVVDQDFATRDLLRAMQSSAHFYVLTISGHESRLIEVLRDKVVGEYGAKDGFPFRDQLYNTHAAERSQAGVEENLMKEFCNRLDKVMQAVHAENPLPVIVAADERNVRFLQGVADKPSMYIGSITGSPDDVKPHILAEQAFAEVEQVMAERRKGALDAISKAQGAGKLMDDAGEIFRAAQAGQGDTLYVEEGYFQPARVDGGTVTLKEDPTEAGVVDDIIDEIAEDVLRYGGHVVFLPEGALREYRKLCLTVRY